MIEIGLMLINGDELSAPAYSRYQSPTYEIVSAGDDGTFVFEADVLLKVDGRDDWGPIAGGIVFADGERIADWRFPNDELVVGVPGQWIRLKSQFRWLPPQQA